MGKYFVAGVDEAGRGCVLGPLALGIVLIEKEREEELLAFGVKDSKLLTRAKREELEEHIKELCTHQEVLLVEPEELNQLMQRHSLNEIEAMKIGALLDGLPKKAEALFVDAPDVIAEKFSQRIKNYSSTTASIRSEHKADLNYPVVAAASILAKVARDHALQKLSEVHGELGSGYSHDPVTKQFLAAWIGKHKDLPPFARKEWQTSKDALDKAFQQTLAGYQEGTK